MTTQVKLNRMQWQSLNLAKRKITIFHLVASAVVFFIGCGIIFNMRAKLIGEDGSTMAMYCLGTLFILIMNLTIFSNKLENPELLALKLCLTAVILTGVWVNVEEKIVMPLLSAGCDRDCTIVYERTIPFSDVDVIYREGRGWRVLEE